MEVHYRSLSLLENNFAVSAVFRGKPASRKAESKRMLEESRINAHAQPRQRAPDCIFKNPDSVPAGKLMEEWG